jgi:hypothetical protein
MKNFLLTLLLIAMVYITHAQIFLEQTYPGSATMTELALSGNKYYMMDVAANQCKIYNMDHSVWKTINLSIPAGMYLYDIKFVSETLFNSDSKVELAYIYYSYDTTLYYYTYYMKVVNESGIELLSVPGCGYPELKQTIYGNTKMMAYVYNYAVYPSTVNTMVYSLPGTIPTGGVSESPAVNNPLPFPNPAREMVKIPCHLPEGVTQGDVLLFSQTGQLLHQYRVDQHVGQLQVMTGQFPKGMLIYQVKNGQSLISSGKFIHE